MTQFLTPISRAHYNNFFRIGQSSIPFPEISRSNSGYILDVSQPSILSLIVKNHLLYPGDFLFINASEFHFLNDYDVSLILNFLSSLNDIDWYLCIEYTDISTSFFEGDNDVFMSLSIRFHYVILMACFTVFILILLTILVITSILLSCNL
jgi:hypothetical protein